MKRRIHTAIASFATVLVLGGCATWQAPPQAANYGQLPVSYEDSVRTYMENYLKDPASATYRFGKPVRAYTNFGWAQPQGGQVEWTGHLVRVEINAKNSYGGYTGYRPYMILFTDNDVYRVIPGSEHPLVHIVH